MSGHTSFGDAQLQSGAVFSAAEGRASPALHYGSARCEYEAAKTSAALFDFSFRNQIEIGGSDRVKFLHNFCTNDIKRLDAGQSCEAFITSVKGRVLGHVWVSVGPSAIWLDCDAGSAERLVPHLERYVINEDVTITDRTPDIGALFVTGPDWAARLAQIGIAPESLRRFDLGARPGFVLAVPRDDLAERWNRLREGGFHPAGSETWEALRIEAGLPIYGVDVTDENLVQEVRRTKTAVSFTKGCYLGQEPIARLDAMGHVNRELCSLRLADSPVPPRGARVVAQPDANEPVGTVTSAAFSFGSESPVAIAILRSSASAVGTEVYVRSDTEPGRGVTTRATVFWEPAD